MAQETSQSVCWKAGASINARSVEPRLGTTTEDFSCYFCEDPKEDEKKGLKTGKCSHTPSSGNNLIQHGHFEKQCGKQCETKSRKWFYPFGLFNLTLGTIPQKQNGLSDNVLSRMIDHATGAYSKGLRVSKGFPEQTCWNWDMEDE